MELGPILRSILRSKARFGLVAAEVSLTLAVVVNCFALVADARGRMNRSSGFDDENLLSVRVASFDPAARDAAVRRATLRADLDALARVPSVRAVTSTNFLPWIRGGIGSRFRRIEAGADAPMLPSQLYSADESTLESLGAVLVEGRTFTAEEVERSTRRFDERAPGQTLAYEAVISAAWAEHLLGSGPHLGRRFLDRNGNEYRVVGVFEQFFNPFSEIGEYAVFRPYRAWTYGEEALYLVRSRPGEAARLAAEVEAILLAENPERSVWVQRVTDMRYVCFGFQRVVSVLMAVVAALLIAVTGLGIVGMTSFLVAERTRQIGTRRALGATMVDILRYFLLENWLVMSVGIAVGAALAVALNMALVSAVAEAKINAGVVATGAIALWLLGLAAALVPALRAARTSPAVATRSV